LIRTEWIKLRDELEFQYFDIDEKMRLQKNIHHQGIYQEVLNTVSEKLQRLDGLINLPIEKKLTTTEQLLEFIRHENNG
jgi:hypothetical protein